LKLIKNNRLRGSTFDQYPREEAQSSNTKRYFRKITNAEPKDSVPATDAYLALLNPAFRLEQATGRA